MEEAAGGQHSNITVHEVITTDGKGCADCMWPPIGAQKQTIIVFTQIN